MAIWLWCYRREDTLPPEQRLLRAAAEFTGRDGGWQLARSARGKPYFPNRPHLHCSVTHSGDYWLCALSQTPLGIDLQQKAPRRRTQELAERFFHPQETAYLQAHPHDFFRLWAAKESYVKYTGSGIDGSFGAFSVVAGDTLAEAVNGAALRELPFAAEYALFVCGGTPPVRLPEKIPYGNF